MLKNFNFDYNFADKQFEKKYQKEEQKSKILLYAVLLAIFISMMRLFALTSLTIQRRLKEIAIRKTLGASLRENYNLLARDLLKMNKNKNHVNQLSQNRTQKHIT
ncbi:MAG: hypothetical protein K9I68_07795 [Bacteroidales bacterium]|nr:hypothetical protein [Bacteroidales bacterium]MCF8338593.1 hypothetical protein [Bacteroidales bacterium]